MKNSLKTAAITLFTSVLLAACATTPSLPAPTVIANSNHTSTVTLTLGQNVFIKDQQLNLSFDKVINDSRCPIGVQCIWAGNATVAVSAMTTSSRPQTLNLSIGDIRGDLIQTQRFANFDIALDRLSPTPAPIQNNTSSAANLPTIQLTIKPIN